MLVTIVNVVRSLKRGAVAGPDPWKANTLEWFTTSPPPVNNFDVVPRVRSAEPMKDIRREIERRGAGARAAGGRDGPGRRHAGGRLMAGAPDSAASARRGASRRSRRARASCSATTSS